MGGVVLRRLSAEEPQAPLDVERVRDGADEAPAGLEDALHLGYQRLREREMLEKLTRDHGVEALVGEGERLLHVGDDWHDPALFCLRERRLVDVDPDDLVPLEEVLSEGAGAAAEV